MTSSPINPAACIVKKDKAGTFAFWLLTIVVSAVYLPAVFNDFVDWDDLTFIIQNPQFNHPTLATVGYYFTHPFQNLYVPVTCAVWAGLGKIGSVKTSDALGAQINPYVFHLASVLLQTIASLTVFGILCRTIKKIWPSCAAALLFAIHPLQVESVAFVGAMNTVLAGTLALLAIWSYLKSATAHSRGPYLFGLVLFVLALLSKPTAIVAPAIAFLLDRIANPRSFRAAALSILPWILLAVPCVIWTQQLQHGAKIAVAEPILMRPIIAGDAAAFYLHKLIRPIHLGIDYGQTPRVLLQNLSGWIILPITMLLVMAFVRHRLPLIATGIALFFIGLLPNSGLVPFDYQQFSTTADRYVYLSMLGVGVIFADVVGRLNWRIGLAMCVAVFAGFGILTELQIRTWQNGETLFRHAIAINPNSWMSRSNLANVIMDNFPDEAIAQCRLAVQIQPDFTPAWGNLGSALEIKGDRAAAVDAFARAYQLDPITPPYAANYARALAETGRTLESAEIDRQIPKQTPTSSDAPASLDRVSPGH